MDSSDEIGSDFIFELCGEVTRLPAIQDRICEVLGI